MNNNKIEDMLTQLITIVGTMQADFQEMKAQMNRLEARVGQLETKSDERHKEIMNQFKTMETDQNFIWEKTVRNEREIATIKGQLS